MMCFVEWLHYSVSLCPLHVWLIALHIYVEDPALNDYTGFAYFFTHLHSFVTRKLDVVLLDFYFYSQ